MRLHVLSAAVAVVASAAALRAQTTQPAEGAVAPAASVPAEAVVVTPMERALPEVNFTEVPLADVIDFLRDVSGANIFVNWRALETIGIYRQTTITVDLRNVPPRAMLKYLLAATGKGDALAHYTEDNVLTITTLAEADRKLITRVYDIADLIVEIPNFKGPSFDLGRTSATGGGGGGEALLSDTGDEDEDQPLTRRERAEQLVDLIKETVRPDVWRDNGGTASIRYFNGQLIITAPRSVHQQIGG